MKFGYCAPIFAGEGDTHVRTPLLERVDTRHLADAIAEAGRLGYDSLWAPDHLMLGRDSLVLECLTFLAWSSRLSNMRLGTIHLSNFLRSPALLARMLATLDVLSGGGVDLFFEPGHQGIRRESEAYGYDFPDEETILDRFVESVQVIRAMWTQERPSFTGKHFQVNGAVCDPRPVQSPMPPLWIGAIGPRAATVGSSNVSRIFDVIAEYADGCKVGPAPLQQTKAVLDLVEKACAKRGRDFTQMKKLYSTQVLVAESETQVSRLKELISSRNPNTPHYADWDKLQEQYLIGTPETVIKQVEAYAELGIDHFFLWFMDYPSKDSVRTFAKDVMPYFRGA